MNVFDYFFSCFRYIINVLNHDFFGLGFTYLVFILSCSLALIILKFLLQGFNVADNFFSFSSTLNGITRDYKMTHKDRERQVVTNYLYNDLNNNSNTIVRSTKDYNSNGDLVSVYNEKYKF